MASSRRSGVGLFLSALNVRYRDVPVRDPVPDPDLVLPLRRRVRVSALPEKWQWVLSLNPMTAVITGFQWGVLGTAAPDLGQTARERRRDRRLLRRRALVLPSLPSRASRTRSDGDRSRQLRRSLEALPDRRAPRRVRNAARLAGSRDKAGAAPRASRRTTRRSGRCATSRSRCARARCSASSAGTAPASRRCSRS